MDNLQPISSLYAQLVAGTSALRAGQVIAYPTEAVFGLGCDPDSLPAVAQLLSYKQRLVTQGLILVAADYSQLQPYIDEDRLPEAAKQRLLASWPGPINWVVPASINTPGWLTGRFNNLAVRVSAHPLVHQLCQTFGKPVTSTSANIIGKPPCRTAAAVRAQWGDQLFILSGEVGGERNPCEIRDAMTNDCLRPS